MIATLAAPGRRIDEAARTTGSPVARTLRLWVAGLWLLFCVGEIGWCAGADDDIVVHVKKDGAAVVVEVDCPVTAPIEVAWEVLTDYDNMTSFLPNLEISHVESRNGNVLQIHQKGKSGRGPFAIHYDNVREVDLVPMREIRSRLISGDMKASIFTTRIAGDEASVHILNSGRYIPNMWVPPMLGPSIIESETKKHFGQIRAEILRRSAIKASGSR